MLLLSKPVQELVRLGQNLRDESVFVEIFDVEHLSVHLVAVMGCLIDVSQQVLVLEIQSPILLEVVSVLIIFWRETSSLHLFHVNSSDLGRRDGSRSERHRLLLLKVKAPTANRPIVEVHLITWASPEAVRR